MRQFIPSFAWFLLALLVYNFLGARKAKRRERRAEPSKPSYICTLISDLDLIIEAIDLVRVYSETYDTLMTHSQ